MLAPGACNTQSANNPVNTNSCGMLVGAGEELGVTVQSTDPNVAVGVKADVCSKGSKSD